MHLEAHVAAVAVALGARHRTAQRVLSGGDQHALGGDGPLRSPQAAGLDAGDAHAALDARARGGGAVEQRFVEHTGG